ncbi:MAG: aminotransferase class I/II-fold pyridoxal phosphate-dependent enzyme [Actinomycetota bacterium]
MKGNNTKLYATKGVPGKSPRRSGAGVTLKVAYDKSSETLDLSSTVNQYGPPQSVMDALAGAPSQDLRMPAWESAALIRHAYSNALKTPVNQLAAFRGVTDFVNAVAQTVPHNRVSVPLPAPAGLLKGFPGRQLRGSLPGSLPSLELINEAMATSDLVVITNPNHLVGTHTDPSSLVEVALAHPDCFLVVDESHIDFLDEPSAHSLVGAPTDNIIAVRSTSDFFGIPSSPVAVAWCADAVHIARITGRDRSQLKEGQLAAQECRQIGAMDAVATAAALETGEWAARAKLLLTYDALWLSQLLSNAPGRLIEHGVGVHYRTFLTRHVNLMSQTFRSHGVQVLELGGSEAEGPRGLRILAPNFEGQPLVQEAVDEIIDRTGDAPPELETTEKDLLRRGASS